jgi:hypothetical protein
MRKSDKEVREVVCSETGKPMPKIPLWIADVNVKFVSDEARQKHSSSHGVIDEPAARLYDVDDEETKEPDVDADETVEPDIEIEDDLDADEIEEEVEV